MASPPVKQKRMSSRQREPNRRPDGLTDEELLELLDESDLEIADDTDSDPDYDPVVAEAGTSRTTLDFLDKRPRRISPNYLFDDDDMDHEEVIANTGDDQLQESDENQPDEPDDSHLEEPNDDQPEEPNNSINIVEAQPTQVHVQMTREKELLASLPFKEQCADHDLLPPVYEFMLNKYQNQSQITLPPTLAHPRILENLDLEVARAERLYYACAYRQCFSLTQEILKKDPYHTGGLPIHISCLVELKEINKLYYLAHDLVDLMPDKAVSWFAVGCYYYLTGKRDPARRYLGKATALDRLFGPAWLAYGHSFAAENEHDQAMAAYFSATKLMKGCHLPLLYIGLECGLTNNVRLAERYFSQAQSIAPHDPFVIHEMGIIAFQNQDYNMAEKHFLTALSQVHEINQSIIAEKWEPLLNNLGHTCRKLKKYDDALRYHQQALMLFQQNASTLACIGFVQALQNNLTDAVDTFHKALGLRRDDSFSITMLSHVIEQLMDSTPPFQGAPDFVPGFEPVRTTPNVPMDDLTNTIVLDDKRLSEKITPSSSPTCYEVEMQDSFQDENTS